MAEGQEIVVELSDASLPGKLTTPPDAKGLVVFAHGSGSSRLSPRNRIVAEQLEAAGLATLLLDLLTESEAVRRGNVFDVDLLGRRLTGAVDWAGDRRLDLPVGLFGASTGAAAALVAAADREVSAVVSRGGRPDLARDRLAAVAAPVLLIVGSRDDVVLDLNRRAAAGLAGPNEVAVVAGAGHLFEEAGALEQVADLAASWFLRWLPP